MFYLCSRTFGDERVWVDSVAVMKNKKQFVSATYLYPDEDEVSIQLWDIETRRCVRTFTKAWAEDRESCFVVPLDDESFLCCFFPSNPGLMTGLLLVYNITSNDYVKRIEVDDLTDFSTSLAILERDRVVVGTAPGDVEVWSLDTGERLQTIRVTDNNEVHKIITKVDDTRFLCDTCYLVVMVDVETGEIIRWFDTNGIVESIDVVDSDRILTMHRSYHGEPHTHQLNMWNMHTGECTQTITTNENIAQILPVRGHGFLRIDHNDARIKLWDSDLGNQKRSFIGHASAVSSIDIVNDTTFISWSCDGAIKLWDLTRWRYFKTLIGLRKLHDLGRAEKLQDAQSLHEGVHEMLPYLQDLVCETSYDVFTTVLSFIGPAADLQLKKESTTIPGIVTILGLD